MGYLYTKDSYIRHTNIYEHTLLLYTRYNMLKYRNTDRVLFGILHVSVAITIINIPYLNDFHLKWIYSKILRSTLVL